MAEVLVSALVNTIVESFKSLALQEFGVAWGLETELERLKSTFTTIQAVLEDAEKMQRKSAALKDWLIKLKDAAYDTEDILDEFATETLRRKAASQRGVIKQVRTFFTCQNPSLFQLNMGSKVKDIRGRLDAIANERSNFHLKEGITDSQVDDTVSRQTTSIVHESEIYGRNEEKERVVEALVNNMSNQDDLSVYAICGMGGLGKTTLAKLVYNDEKVEKHFELRIWVCVSDDFSLERLSNAIIESIEGSRCNVLELDPLVRRLQKKLREKRFLLVLDDVWNENHHNWDGLKDVLRCGAAGSMLVITTRLQGVAQIMATLPIHHLGYLSEDDSWTLFKRLAFGGIDRREDNLELETIGKAIVKRCGGVPLALKAIGSLLRFKRSTREWLSVKETTIWDLSRDYNDISVVLRLSYDNLPPHLRQCFAYCSIFPKDEVMEVDMLVELWMANGFIPCKEQANQLSMGHDCFHDLVGRSFFQDIKGEFGGNLTCKMHDLMHDLAQSIMMQECYIVEPAKELKVLRTVRHLSFLRTVSEGENIPRVQSLRSFLLPYGLDRTWVRSLAPYISKQKYLRVLVLESQDFQVTLPSSIGNLKHLRYLSLSNDSIKTLPESISCLHNLQTLKLDCDRLLKLPKGMKQMRNLQCLDIIGCQDLICMPVGLGQLTYLQVLSKFIVGQNYGQQIGELKELNLSGVLKIEGLENVRNPEDARSANLKSKQNLCLLQLCWGNIEKDNLRDDDEQILDGLQPHSNLKRLGIDSYQGLKFPNWMMDFDLQNLVEISLIRCPRCERLPPLGKLPFLKNLSIDGMGAVKYFKNECYRDGETSFPALETLSFFVMPSFEEWTTTDIGEHFPRLRDLAISDCPRLVELPNLSALKTMLILGCSGLEDLAVGLKNFTSLESLSLTGFQSLTSLPATWLQGLSSLRTLLIDDCKKLMSLSEGVQQLTALKFLRISTCPEMTSFPEEMQHLNALQHLQLLNCEGLVSLPNWLGSLRSLSFLEIWDCHNMMSLPDGLESLKSLNIWDCPHLERRCEKEKGEDWPKISHIPKISIGGRNADEEIRKRRTRMFACLP